MDDIEKEKDEKELESVLSLPTIEGEVAPEVSGQVFSLPPMSGEEKIAWVPEAKDDDPDQKIFPKDLSFEQETSVPTPVAEIKAEEEKDTPVATPPPENISHEKEEREKFKVVKKVGFFKLKSKKILSWILWLIRCEISIQAKEIYDISSFVLGDTKKTVELVFIKPEYLGLVSNLSGGFTYKKVSEAAIEAGLMLCPQDTVFNLVLRGKRPKKGIEWIVGMEPIPDAKGKVFSVVHYYDGSVQIQTVDSSGLSSKDSIWIFQK